MSDRAKSLMDAVEIVHRDAELLVLHKPSGLSTTSPEASASTLVRAAHALDPGAERLHPSSRLDAEVSGLVTFARTVRATQFLLDARAAGRYARVYLALVARAPVPPAGSWSGAIEIDPHDARKRRVGTSAAAKASHTQYRTLAESALGAVLFLEPTTGRTHQLRVHAAAAGVPLLGDRPYAGPNRLTLADGRVVAARRVMLHCTRISLPAHEGRPALRLQRLPPADFVEPAELIAGESIELLLERAPWAAR